MVTLEQIRQLDSRVHRALELISRLREENYTLKNRLAEYQDRIEELEVLIANFKEDQSAIEQGIANAISELDQLDDGAKAAPAAPETRPEAPRETHHARERLSTAHTGQPSAKTAGPSRQPRAQEERENGSGAAEAELDIF